MNLEIEREKYLACAKVREKICEKERKRERKIDELYKYYMDIIYTHTYV